MDIRTGARARVRARTCRRIVCNLHKEGGLKVAAGCGNMDTAAAAFTGGSRLDSVALGVSYQAPCRAKCCCLVAHYMVVDRFRYLPAKGVPGRQAL